jgi:methionyl-tRNA formyltransferase
MRTALLSLASPLCISFYNDYIFRNEEIDAFGCMVNIHPALPSLRGRGYDTLPIIQAHGEYGATLHFVNENIDAGRIIEVITRPMPQPVNHATFRRLTQELSLVMLEQLLKRCSKTGLANLTLELKHQARNAGLHWSGKRLTSSQLVAILRDLRRLEPHHPALQGLAADLEAPVAA